MTRTSFRLLSALGTALAAVSCTAPQTGIRLHVDEACRDMQITVTTRDSVYPVSTDSTGSAYIILKPGTDGHATLHLGQTGIPFYIAAGQEVDIDTRSMDRNTGPVFTGAYARENSFINGPEYRNLCSVDYRADEDVFLAALARQEKEMTGRLDAVGLDTAVTSLEKRRINYMVYGCMPVYAAYRPYYGKDGDTALSAGFLELVGRKLVEDRSLNGSDEYGNAMDELIRFQTARAIPEYDPLAYALKQVELTAGCFSDPRMAERFSDLFLTAYIGREGIAHLDRIRPVYERHVRSASRRSAFNALCSRWERIAPGKPSPDFNCTDANGNRISLRDLAGKYVYIDVWATWCGPCRGELPHLKRLERRFRDRNIHFVSLSCDQDRNAWKQAVREGRLGGIQLHMGEDKAFMSAYMIKGIPRFILLDREGRIIRSRMTRPSSESTLHTLEELEGI